MVLYTHLRVGVAVVHSSLTILQCGWFFTLPNHSITLGQAAKEKPAASLRTRATELSQNQATSPSRNLLLWKI